MGWMLWVAPILIVAVILVWLVVTLVVSRNPNWRRSQRRQTPHRGEVSGGTQLGGPSGANNRFGPDAEDVHGPESGPETEPTDERTGGGR